MRAADLFFHMGMVFGNSVLLLRVRAIFPHEWNTASKILHIMVIVVRLAIGVVDISLLTYTRGPRGMCRYQESAYASIYQHMFSPLVLFLIQHI